MVAGGQGRRVEDKLRTGEPGAELLAELADKARQASGRSVRVALDVQVHPLQGVVDGEFDHALDDQRAGRRVGELLRAAAPAARARRAAVAQHGDVVAPRPPQQRRVDDAAVVHDGGDPLPVPRAPRIGRGVVLAVALGGVEGDDAPRRCRIVCPQPSPRDFGASGDEPHRRAAGRLPRCVVSPVADGQEAQVGGGAARDAREQEQQRHGRGAASRAGAESLLRCHRRCGVDRLRDDDDASGQLPLHVRSTPVAPLPRFSPTGYAPRAG